mgnify:CR=1 FL=1
MPSVVKNVFSVSKRTLSRFISNSILSDKSAESLFIIYSERSLTYYCKNICLFLKIFKLLKLFTWYQLLCLLYIQNNTSFRYAFSISPISFLPLLLAECVDLWGAFVILKSFELPPHTISILSICFMHPSRLYPAFTQ